MFSLEQIISYFKEVARSIKFQLSAIVTFGSVLWLVWFKEGSEIKIILTILFLFPLCIFLFSIVEKAILFFIAKVERRKHLNNLTPEELEFISYYTDNDTKTRYMPCINGTYKDSGIINPLITKNILYIASNMSEYRGDHWMSKEQYLPINIHDDIFAYFKKNYR